MKIDMLCGSKFVTELDVGKGAIPRKGEFIFYYDVEYVVEKVNWKFDCKTDCLESVSISVCVVE